MKEITTKFVTIVLKENAKVIGNVYMGNRDFKTKEIGYIIKATMAKKVERFSFEKTIMNCVRW